MPVCQLGHIFLGVLERTSYRHKILLRRRPCGSLLFPSPGELGKILRAQFFYWSGQGDYF